MGLSRRIWNHYRRDGLLSLFQEADERARNAIPFDWRLQVRQRRQRLRWGEAAVDRPLRVFWVRPDAIQKRARRFERSRYIGTALGGDWDVETSEWGDATAESFRARFIDGCEWAATPLYQKARRRIEEDGYYLGYTDFETFETERLPYLDDLFESIRENGYRTQAELTTAAHDQTRHGSVPEHHHRTHEIGCNIARDGALLFNSGKHRLCIARLLGLDAVPIQIIVRHTEWMKRRRVAATAEGTDWLVAQRGIDPDHPDLTPLLSQD